MESVEVMAERPRGEIPSDPWSTGDPRYGIDEDRPGDAVLRFRGGVARWLAAAQWHPTQMDTWLERGELLERRFRYRSCRELARLLASVADGIESIGPDELRTEVVQQLRRGLDKLGGADTA